MGPLWVKRRSSMGQANPFPAANGGAPWSNARSRPNRQAPMENLTVIGNRVEAGLWFVIAAGFLIRAWRTAAGHRRLAGILALAFLAFGISDLIEARTGAWWRPLWLLILKTVCVGIFAYGLREHLRIRKHDDASSRR